jgi:hypothetical protein
MHVRNHLQSHNISLPLSLLVKGIRGRFGWGMGIKKVFLRKKVLRVFMNLIAFSIQKNIKPNSNPQTPKGGRGTY